MRQSNLFLKTHKDYPKDEPSVNARLLIKGNFIHKLMAGVFSFLPLGFKVKKKVENIIREEMNLLGAAEIFMPALHPRSVWDVTGRWEDLKEIMYQFNDRSDREIGLGTTHEEIVALIGSKIIFSYQNLPLSVYQIQTKFRDEPRAKSGLLRGREFTMKDLYSFHADQDSLNNFYEEAKGAYKRIFEKCGLRSVITEASGGAFSKDFSDEFMVEAPAGEDRIALCRLCGFAQNTEVASIKKGEVCPGCGKGVVEEVKAIEAGNIFKLGTKFSEPSGLRYKNKKGDELPVVMGSYGIGIERLIGTVVEVHNDEKGIIWPDSVAPADAHLLLLSRDKKVVSFADKVYNLLRRNGVDVLYDDRPDAAPGEKFADADLLGIPWRLVISEKTIVQDKVEVKRRSEDKTKLVKTAELKKITKHSL